VRANVSGCDAVRGIEIYNDKRFLISFDTRRRCRWTSSMSGEPVQPALPIAGDRGAAQPEGARDLRRRTGEPIDRPGPELLPGRGRDSPGGAQLDRAPDSFVAEGGVGSTPTTFIGCVGTSSGTALARFDTMGNVVSANTSLPAASAAPTTR